MLIRTVTVPASSATVAPFSGVTGVRDVAMTNVTTETIQVQRFGSTDKFYFGSGASISLPRCIVSDVILNVSSTTATASVYAYASTPHERV